VKGSLSVRTRACVLAFVAFSCASAQACRPRETASAPAPSSPRGTGAARGWHYVVDAKVDASLLAVQALLPAAFAGTFRVDQGAGPFLHDLEVLGAAGWRAVRREDDSWSLPECVSRACQVRYQYALGEAAASLDDVRYAAQRGDALVATPAVFLLRPQLIPEYERYSFEVRSGKARAFVTGLEQQADGSYGSEGQDLPIAPYSGFGRFRSLRLRVDGSVIDVAIVPGKFPFGDQRLRRWLLRAARLASSYFGRFPVPRVLVIIAPSRGRRLFGTQMGGGGASIYFDIGSDVSEEQLSADWMGPHEMMHLGQPGLAREHLWFQEGFATYVEPLARLAAGEISQDELWEGFLRGMRNGEPEAGDRGLDRTPTWGRTYWGGALFWLLADVETRRLSGGRRSARDAARAVLESVGDCAITASIDDVLEAADRGAGHSVFRGLYDRHAPAATSMGLRRLSDRLGVRLDEARVRYDDDAPWAWIRRSISQRGSQ